MKKLNVIIFLVLSLSAWGQNESIFDTATEAYNQGDFNKAIESYLSIIEAGEHSAALYFNLGNSYYKLNQIAPSIYYYEKALLLKPNDSEIKNNLGYAQNMTLDAIDTIPQTGFSKIYNDIIKFFFFDEWALIAVIGIVLFVLLYLTFYFLRYASQKRFAFILSLVALFIAIVAVVIAFLQYNEFKADQPAIIFDSEVSVKSEPNKRSQQIFQLHEGTKVQVLEELNDWNKIKIADGQIGWLPSESIKTLKDF